MIEPYTWKEAEANTPEFQNVANAWQAGQSIPREWADFFDSLNYSARGDLRYVDMVSKIQAMRVKRYVAIGLFAAAVVFFARKLIKRAKVSK